MCGDESGLGEDYPTASENISTINVIVGLVIILIIVYLGWG